MIHYLKPFTPCHHLSRGHKLSKPRRGGQILSRSLLVLDKFSPSPAAGCKSPLSKVEDNLSRINCTYSPDAPIRRRSSLRLWWIQTVGDGAARQNNPPTTFLPGAR